MQSTQKKVSFSLKQSLFKKPMCSFTEEITFFPLVIIRNPCDETCSSQCTKLQIWSHLLKKSLMKNFFFCRFHIVSTWNTRGVFVGKTLQSTHAFHFWLFDESPCLEISTFYYVKMEYIELN